MTDKVELYIEIDKYVEFKNPISLLKSLGIGHRINPILDGFSEWADENGIHYWIDNMDDASKIRIYFDDETDYMAAKVGWF